MKRPPADRGSADELNQQAAEWVMRKDLHDTPELTAELDKWLATDVRHRAAYLRISVAWERASAALRRLRPLSGKVDRNLLAPSRRKRFGSGSRRGSDDAGSLWANAARGASRRRVITLLPRVLGVLVLLAALGLAWNSAESEKQVTYSTQVGELKKITLSDASTLALNTDTELRVRMTRNRRDVNLVRGEVLVTVADERDRPFELRSAAGTVKANHARFVVRMRSDYEADVLVAEGNVAAAPFRRRAKNSESVEAPAVVLSQNDRASITPIAVTPTHLSPQEIERKMAWTSGRIRFDGETLAEAVAEFNRYEQRQLVIEDPAAASLRISGGFETRHVEVFVRVLQTKFGVRLRLREPGKW